MSGEADLLTMALDMLLGSGDETRKHREFMEKQELLQRELKAQNRAISARALAQQARIRNIQALLDES